MHSKSRSLKPLAKNIAPRRSVSMRSGAKASASIVRRYICAVAVKYVTPWRSIHATVSSGSKRDWTTSGIPRVRQDSQTLYPKLPQNGTAARPTSSAFRPKYEPMLYE
jgi:hypothetical protein